MAAPMENMIVLTVLAFISLTAGFEDEFEGSRTLSLEHSFDQGLDPVFTKRGTLVIKSVQSKRATFSQSAPLSKDDRQLLRSTVDDDGMYRVRIPIRETEEGTVYVSSFTRASYIEKLKREEQEKTKGGKSDDRSFFAKYWMYIVPFVIIMFVMQSMDPNQGGGGGGGS
ncbi:EMC10-like protein [Mya arenaria]|uniref:ER membrane protein complex subunit 10 n=1 Tax=Mya arenaria TaxID=6604 RepID=A0ABY7DYB4_MYAAR|nr:EMC10-like protein [Mya arenaria]WAR01656.1 EMC10-like protein [Mya arenaria]